MSEQKIYVGGATEKNGNFGAFHKISFKREDLDLMIQNLNSKGYVNLNMNRRREPSQYGQTHSLVIDTWQPDPQQVQQFQQGQHPQYQQPVHIPPQEAFNEIQPMVGNDPQQLGDINDPEDCPF